MGDVVVGDEGKDLGLVYVSCVGKGMKDPVGINGKGASVVFCKDFFRAFPSGVFAQCGIGRKPFGLFLFEPFPPGPYIHGPRMP